MYFQSNAKRYAIYSIKLTLKVFTTKQNKKYYKAIRRFDIHYSIVDGRI